MVHRCLISLLLGSTALVGSGAAYGQTADSQTTPSQVESESGGLVQTDIVVTATRDTRRLQDVPMSVNVATGEQLEKLSLFDAKDVQQLAPSLELTNTSGRNNTTTLRGISFDPDSGTGPTVQTYVNEVPANAQTVFTALYDIGQIEVLRGPQGLQRGLSSPAGSITITTRRPGFDEIEGYAQATATDLDGYNFQGGVTLPFSEQFSLRVAGLFDQNRVNYVNNISNGDRSRQTTMSARITAGFRPTDTFTAYLTYQYLESDTRQYQQVVGSGAASTGIPTGPVIAVEEYLAVQEGPGRYQNRSHQITLNTEWDLGPATLTGLAAYQYTALEQFRDQDAGNALPGYQNNQEVFSPYKVPTFELRLATNDNGSFGGGIGAFYTRQTGTTIVDQPNDIFFTATLPPSFGFYLPVAVNTVVPVDSSTWSFNGNAHATLGDLRIEGGLRYTLVKATRVTDVNLSSPGFPPFFIPPFTETRDGIPASLRDQRADAFTGGLTLTYTISRDFNVYAAYSRSFRPGSVGVAVPLGVSTDLIATQDETTDSFEVGFKGSILDRRVNFAVAAFYQKFDNFISRFTGIQYNCPTDSNGQCTTDPAAPPINSAGDLREVDGGFDFNYNGDATVKGIEATIDARPTSFWDVSLSLAYIQARWSDDARLPCNDFDGDGVPGGNEDTPAITGSGNVSFCQLDRLSDTPDFSLSANTELRIPLNGTVTPFVRGLVSYRPKVFSLEKNYTYESRTLVNLYAGVRTEDGKWELTGFVKNLLDQQRVTNISSTEPTVTAQDGSVFESGYRLINTTAPREFGATLAFRW